LSDIEEEPIIGFCDESAFYPCMNSRRVLNTKIAKCRTDKKKIAVFGTMLMNGNDVAMLSEDSKAVDFIRFLETVRIENPKRTVVLILDNAKIHHAIVTQKRDAKNLTSYWSIYPLIHLT